MLVYQMVYCSQLSRPQCGTKGSQTTIWFTHVDWVRNQLCALVFYNKWANALVPPTPILRPWLSDVILDVSIFVICPKVIF